MHEIIIQMSHFMNRGWDLSRFDSLADWAAQLSGIRSSVLERHQSTLLRLSDLIERLQLPPEEEEEEEADEDDEEEEEEEEGPSAIVTRSKGKERTVVATEVKASEEIVLNEIPVSGATIHIAIYLF